MTEFEDIRIDVPWGHIVGRWYGNRKVRPILALHGWLDNLGTWDTLIPLLPAHLGILCIDLPGHGRSSRHPKGIAYHTLDYAHIIARVMTEYNWKKVSLMGHSLGSILCFIYTSLFPQTVDMVIAIDCVQPAVHTLDFEIRCFASNVEKSIVEDKRLDNADIQEPPAYSYEQLERVLYEGSMKSVDLENTKHILNRSIAKSTKFPYKYYFSRDGRAKYYTQFSASQEFYTDMGRRIKDVPYLVLKASGSSFLNKNSPIIDIISRNNPHFEYYEVEGTHHLHLNNAAETAALLRPFLHKHRPMTLSAWTVDEQNEGMDERRARSARAGGGIKKWLRSKL